MPIYQAIETFKQNPISTEAQAQLFLNSLHTIVQQQFIAALYHGRDHIHSDRLLTDRPISRLISNHISMDEYANIISSKGHLNITTYLNKMVQCSSNSGFNLNNL